MRAGRMLAACAAPLAAARATCDVYCLGDTLRAAYGRHDDGSTGDHSAPTATVSAVLTLCGVLGCLAAATLRRLAARDAARLAAQTAARETATVGVVL